MPVVKQIFKSKTKRKNIIFFAAAIAVLAIVYAIIMLAKMRTPVYFLDVDGLDAKTPSEAQAALRADYKNFIKLNAQNNDCVWVWAGGDRVYLMQSGALRIKANDENVNFTAVTFKDDLGDKRSGYIVDPATQPKEIGRIQLVDATELTIDSVSMSIRVGLRNGEISYDDAVYIWEKGSSVVLVVRPDSYEIIEDRIVNFTDDGNVTHTCFVLDTKI